MRGTVSRLAGALLAGLLAAPLGGCKGRPAGEFFVWASAPAPGYAGQPAPIGMGRGRNADSLLQATPVARPHLGALARWHGENWLAADWPDSTPEGAGARRVHVLHAGSNAGTWQERYACAGESPRLVARRAGSLVLLSLERSAAHAQLVARRGSADGRRWDEARPLWGSGGPAPDSVVAAGTPCEDAAGTLFVPVVWRRAPRDTACAVRVLASADGGVTWDARGVLELVAAADVALAASHENELLLVARAGSQLLRSTSRDGGSSWTAWEALGYEAFAGRIALVAAAGGAHAGGAISPALALAWTDPGPDTAVALPAPQALRCALSTDGGMHWQMQRPLALRPGRVPLQPALWLDAEHLGAAFVEAIAPGSPGDGGRIVCMGYTRAWLAGAAPSTPAVSAPYGVDPASARSALRLLCAHALARPVWPRRAFVEGYTMRGLADAQAVFDSLPAENPEWFAPHACRARALAWADRLLDWQLPSGYWPTGYGAAYIADMAAAAGIFVVLDSVAAPAQVQRYETAVRRFVAALQEDAMLLHSGAVGVGWPGAFQPRSPTRVSRRPYLVSTALAGVELHAWLYRRAGRTADAEQARRSLDYTLSQLQPDGSLRGVAERGEEREGDLTTAVYVEEGWMAADRLLGDPLVRERFRQVLGPHVQWLLALQQADGSWDSGAEGEYARTPAIVDFLVWYDQRCAVRADVREALRRAGTRLTDTARWNEIGVWRAGYHPEVQRAMAMRALLALSRSAPVL